MTNGAGERGPEQSDRAVPAPARCAASVAEKPSTPEPAMPVRRTSLAALSLSLFASVPILALAPQPARAYDIDCKVILCLAGGFPSGCRDAYRYMIDRITDLPPKPPFGFCAMSNGARYEGTRLDFAALWGRSSYVCPDGLRLSYHVEYLDNGGEREHAFCYRSSRIVETGWGQDRRTEVRYDGMTGALRARWRLGITVEPGTSSEYRSPTYWISHGGGIVLQRP